MAKEQRGAAPSSPTDAVTKEYVDDAVASVNFVIRDVGESVAGLPVDTVIIRRAV